MIQGDHTILNKPPTEQTPPKKQHILKTTLLRLWPFLIILAIVLFPFDWLTQVWPPYRQVFDQVFVSELQHMIGHATLFFFLGLITLIAFPTLRQRPFLYLGLLFLVALGEEALQSIFKQELPNLGDGRDLLLDITGVVIAYIAVWLCVWVVGRVRKPKVLQE